MYLDKIKKLLADIKIEAIVAHKCYTPEILFNANDYLILDLCFTSMDKVTNSFGTSIYQIANELWMTEYDTRVSLERLSCFGLIKCYSEDYIYNIQVTVNPTVYGVITVVGFTKNYKAYISHLCKLGINRKHKFDKPMQGFRVDTLFGNLELETTPYNAERELINILEDRSKEKAEKESKNQSDRALADEFVRGCASLWVLAQSAQGFGSARPNWSLSEMSAKVRAERSELVKTFKSYGGRVAALSWMLFVGGVTELDDNGKVKYSITCPHRQFVTSDKKPSQFTKNFNAILKDPLLHEWAEKEWKVYYPLLKEHYFDSLDALPKCGDDAILSGLQFQKIN
jgi:hypothetical protein